MSKSEQMFAEQRCSDAQGNTLNEFLDDQYQEAEFKINQLKGHTEALDELFKSWGEIFGTKKI